MNMRKLGSMGLWLLLGAATLITSGCPCADLLIRDNALESAIRAELGMPFGCLTEQDLLRVTELQAEGLNIDSLDGLELLRNLTVLNLQNNRIQSITPLASLPNLTFLDVGFNNITSIESVSGLFFLRQLYLDGNPIFDFNPLLANALNNGIGDGTLVVLPDTVVGSDGEIQDIYATDINTLLSLGVRLFVETRPDDAGAGLESGTLTPIEE
jgi:hypothetical protein